MNNNASIVIDDVSGLETYSGSKKFIRFLKKIWEFDLKTSNYSVGKHLTWAVLTISFIFWLLGSVKIQLFHLPLSTESIRIFHLVKEIPFHSIDESVVTILIALSFFRIFFGFAIGLLDMKYYKNIFGKEFDWKGMVNIAFVNIIVFFFGFAFLVFTPILTGFLEWYKTVLDRIPTIIQLNGVVAVVLACAIGDFCFYLTHRLCHNVRLLWNLGHIYHHRHQNLTQFHFGAELDVFLLRASNSASLLLLPLMSKLLTFDISLVGWSLVVMMVIDIFVDPSHSPFLYMLENKYKPLRWLRYFFVTSAVHYTHHSREEKHNKKTGCNFAARFTIWDRLFGTYVEPDILLPDTGLFGKKTDYCNNPIRFILLPYYRFYLELERNKLRYWVPIIFGSTHYCPPNKAKISH